MTVAYLPVEVGPTSSSSSHRRRTSRPSLNAPIDSILLRESNRAASPTKAHRRNRTLAGTPFDEEEEEQKHMSLDRSPSPQRDGGWSSPGLTVPMDELNGSRPRYGDVNGGAGVTWASAKANSARVNGYPSYRSQNQGFFDRHMRKISSSLPNLPYFSNYWQEDRYAEKEKLGRGRPALDPSQWKDLPKHFGLLMSRRRKYLTLGALLGMLLIWLWSDCEHSHPYPPFSLMCSDLFDSIYLLVQKDIMAGRWE